MTYSALETHYPMTDPDAPIGLHESPYVKGKHLKQGHCNGPIGTTYHSGHCSVISWHRQSGTWTLCACDCHDETEDQLRAIAHELHRKTIEGRQHMTATKKKKTTTSREKKNATPARAPKACMCECGDQTKGGRFLPGHDAKLKSQLQTSYREARNKRERDKLERVFHDLKWGKFIPAA
jgi:hypothetical protein